MLPQRLGLNAGHGSSHSPLLPSRPLCLPIDQLPSRALLVRTSVAARSDVFSLPSEPEFSIPIPKLSYPHHHAPGSPLPPQQSRTLQPSTSRSKAKGFISKLGPSHSYAPLSQDQLLELADYQLGSSSEVWSAESRNRPATTSWSEDYLTNLDQHSAAEVTQKVKQLAQEGSFFTAMRILEECLKLRRTDVLERVSHNAFLSSARRYKASKAALGFLHIIPRRFHSLQLYNLVLQACAESRDLTSALAAVELANKMKFKPDVILLTTLIKVCASVGNVEVAHRLYQDMKRESMKLDSRVYGAVISVFAEAMTRDLTTVHERKEQYVLLERALRVVSDAEAAGVHLQVPAWNSLIVCAGRCGELPRAFDLLERMQTLGISPNEITYGSLIESCVLANEQHKALRLFELALEKGFGCVEIYTQAISACKILGAVDLDRAVQIYNQMEYHGVKPDKKLFACLIAVAGRAGKLDMAISLLTDMTAEGIAPSATTCSALIYACLNQGNIQLARKVYDLCQRHDVYPMLSQFNRIMDWYAVQFRFGEVVSLLSDLVSSGRTPNLNTYRIVINACQRADQAGLAFQVFALMHANKVNILQEKFAQSIYYSLLKSCFNQTRYQWIPGGYPPQGPEGSTRLAQVRAAECERVLQALGGAKRNGRRSSTLEGPPDGVDWAAQAISTLHHMMARGYRPSVTSLDLVFNCLRTQRGTQRPLATELPASTLLTPHVEPRSQHRKAEREAKKYDIGFDERAFNIMDEIIRRGLLPRTDPEGALTLNLMGLPPSMAEVYLLHLVLGLERRAAKVGHTYYHHAITIQVPPFNPDRVNWPSYMEKLDQHYTLDLPQEVLDRLNFKHEAPAQPHWNLEAMAGISDSDDSDEEGAQGPNSIDSAYPESSVESDDEASSSGSGHSMYIADSTTGLAVVATLRRIKLFHTFAFEDGEIVVSAKEMARWLRKRKIEQVDAQQALAGQHVGLPHPGMPQSPVIAEQQRNIRSGWFSSESVNQPSTSGSSAPGLFGPRKSSAVLNGTGLGQANGHSFPAMNENALDHVLSSGNLHALSNGNGHALSNGNGQISFLSSSNGNLNRHSSGNGNGSSRTLHAAFAGPYQLPVVPQVPAAEQHLQHVKLDTPFSSIPKELDHDATLRRPDQARPAEAQIAVALANGAELSVAPGMQVTIST